MLFLFILFGYLCITLASMALGYGLIRLFMWMNGRQRPLTYRENSKYGKLSYIRLR